MPAEAKMIKRNLVVILLAMLVAGLCVPPVFAQATGTVKGTCKDVNGQPITDGVVTYTSVDTGRKYQLKTNKKGEFFSLGIAPGKYNVALTRNGQELFHFSGVPVTLDETQNVLDFNLQKEQANAAKGQGLTPEQLKQQQEQKAKVEKENLNIKALNDKLAAARAAMQANQWDQAVQQMVEATQVDPNRDLIWYTLGEAYSGQAKQTAKTDRAAAKEIYTKAIEAYQKAIAIKPVADYYNNLAQAQAAAGQADEAIKSYQQASQLDPTRAGMFLYNIGAVQTNSGKVDDAIETFKKVIAADPNRADAYYQLGVNMLGKATLKGDKMVAPDGTAQAFQKYLELQPSGPYAQSAKDLLASIGSSVETTYGKKKATKSK
jgi:tetratricopeptide (TPR) repeat protein